MSLYLNPSALLLQFSIWDMVSREKALQLTVLGILLVASIVSWAVVFSKWFVFGKARSSNHRFLRAFRKSAGLEAVSVASEQFRPCPLATVFDFGYEEVRRQIKARAGNQ